MHVGQAEHTDGSGARISATEAALLEIWQRLFRRSDINIDDDFFNLGGHSLLATRLIARIRSDLGERLHFKEITDYRTIAELSARIDRGKGAEGA